MTPRERFLAVVRNEPVDYVPIFGFPGAPGMSLGCMKNTHDNLVATGMPEDVGGRMENWCLRDAEGWQRYWGTTTCASVDFGLARGGQWFKEDVRVEDGYEIHECESGAVTRQLIDNANTYTMPEFVSYAVRDRASWEFYRDRTDPTGCMSREEMEENAKRFDDRDQPLAIGAGSTYGSIRGLMGPERASTMFYDDPGLVHEIMARALKHVREYTFPLIERIRPEIVAMGEDLCYNHGMLLSPAQFDEFFGEYYQEVCDCAFANGVAMVAIDTDGNAMEFTGLAASHGVNAIYPYEVKAGNDLFKLREELPEFVLLGWLEKEVVNEGNEHMIENEIMSKVPPLLEKGRYFPNGDHGIQPMVTFDGMRRFMTLLHEVTNNPEGDFPRMGS